MKAALARCSSLGVNAEDFILYLPEIGELEERQPTMSEPFPLLAEDIMALLQDNKECRKQLSDIRQELQLVMLRLDRLTLDQQGAKTVPATTSTTTQHSVISAPPPTSVQASVQAQGASLGAVTESTWATIGSQIPPQQAQVSTAGVLLNRPQGLWCMTGLQWGTPTITSLPVYQVASSVLPPSLLASSTTSMGMPAPGQWLSYMITRPPTTSATWSTVTSAYPGHYPAGPPMDQFSMPWSHWTLPPTSSSLGMPVDPGGMSSWNSALLQEPLGGPPVNVMVDASGIKSASKKRKCVVFDIEPHLHLDNVTATIEDVISTEMSLLESLLTLGFPVQKLTKHVRFLTDKSRVYTSASLVRYDLAMREKAELKGSLHLSMGTMSLYNLS